MLLPRIWSEKQATVEIPDQAEAQAAIDGTNEKDFMGRNLRVNESQPKPQGGGGGRGGRW